MKASLDKLKMHNPQLVFRRPGLILTGWDATDVIRRQQRQEPRFVDMLPGSEQWIRYATTNTSVVLMARDFGDVIQPSSTALVCDSMRQPPINQCSLTVPLYVLRRTAARFLIEPDDSLHGCVQIHDKAYLHMSAPLEKACDCSGGKSCQPISTLRRRAKSSSVINSGPSSTNVFSQYPRAAVIIGRPKLPRKSNGIESRSARRIYRWIKQSVVDTSQTLIGSLRLFDMPTGPSVPGSDEESDSGAAYTDPIHSVTRESGLEHRYSDAPGSVPNGRFAGRDADADINCSVQLVDGAIDPHASFAMTNLDSSDVGSGEAVGLEIDRGADVGPDIDNGDHGRPDVDSSEDGGSVSVSEYQSCHSGLL